jgi:hypothetical protein
MAVPHIVAAALGVPPSLTSRLIPVFPCYPDFPKQKTYADGKTALSFRLDVMLKCSWKLFVKTVLRLFCDVSNSILKP